jgi:hypothetical protein
MNSVINNVINYVLFGIWSFCQVLEYKYYTRVEQYDTIVENTKACKRQYHELLVKMAQLEARIEELSSTELSELSELSESSLEDEELEDEELEDEELEDEELEDKELEDEELEDKELEDKELEDMANEDLHTSVVTSVDTDLATESVPSVESYLATELETELQTLVDTELVDISEETYPVKQQKHNKKGWLKTILFM